MKNKIIWFFIIFIIFNSCGTKKEIIPENSLVQTVTEKKDWVFDGGISDRNSFLIGLWININNEEKINEFLYFSPNGKYIKGRFNSGMFYVDNWYFNEYESYTINSIDKIFVINIVDYNRIEADKETYKRISFGEIPYPFSASKYSFDKIIENYDEKNSFSAP